MTDMIADGPEEDRHLRTIAAHTSAYITHVRRQLKHTLPKAIVHCLVGLQPYLRFSLCVSISVLDSVDI